MQYRMMLVDDEALVTDWVGYLVEDRFGAAFDVYKCNNATQAMQQLLTGIYDIAILDIRMPEVTGLDILAQLEAQKISTLIIFLTAFGQFEYAQRAINPNVVSYVLKGGNDAPLLEAIREAMGRIEETIETKNLLSIAKTRMEASATNIRREYLIKLLNGFRTSGPAVSLLISPEKPVHMLLCALNTPVGEANHLGLLLEMGNHIEEYLRRAFVYEGAMPQKHCFVWLVQPKSGEPADVQPALLAAIENAQMLFQRHTSHDLLFAYTTQPFPLPEAGEAYKKLATLQAYGQGQGHIVLTEEDLPEAGQAGEQPEEAYQEIPRRAIILQRLLENAETEECRALAEEMLAGFTKGHASHDPALIEMFCCICGALLAHLNKTGAYAATSREHNLLWLGNASAFTSWEEAASAIRQLIELLLRQAPRKRDNRSQSCIQKAKDYIAQNLDQELSLVLLAEKVYLNPSYFSILFKRKVGCNVSDYIKGERLKKAKQQLMATRLKISEIARNVGYPNAAYFGKFIKQETGQTPLEYRDRHGAEG